VNNSLEQGSKEWLEFRKNYIGASEAATILKLDPWRTPYNLFEDKLGLIVPRETEAMRRGKEMEAYAREEFEKVIGIKVTPQVLFHPEIKYMMASMDGVSDDGKTAVELKCPGEATYKLAMAGKVPEHYNAQLQHQMAVMGLKSMFYFCFDGSTGIMLEVERNDAMIETIYREEAEFWNRVQNFDPPPLTNKDLVPMDSLEWKQTAFEYSNMKALREKYEREEENLKQRLIEMSGGKSCKGGGVQVSRYIRKGAVDYGSIDELQGLDLEKYRKKPIESWRITCTKE
jgi:putative phage-type endonuclease